MSNNPNDMFGNNRNGSSSTSKSKFKSKTESTFDMFNINTKGAKQDTKDVFDYAKEQVTEFSKFQIKTTAQTMKNIADITVTTYSKIYVQLESMHKSYLSGVISREAEAAKSVAKYWTDARNSSSSSTKPGTILGSNGQPISSNTVSNTSSNKSASESVDISGFMKSLDGSLNNKVSNFGSHLDKSLSKSTSGIGDAVSKGAEKGTSAGVSLAVSVISGIIKIGKQYLDIWLKRFDEGINKIYQTYESTYTNVSVIMDQNQEQYMSWQTQARDSLKSMSLDNNIAISKVMEQLDETTKLGISGQKAQNKALSDSISKTIAPFVEVTSDAYTDLQLKLGDSFVTSMNGLVDAVNDQAGSSRFISKNINSILQELEPIAMNAKDDRFAQQFGEMAAMIDSAVSSGVMTMDEASKMKEEVMGMTDPYKAITEGSVLQKQIVASGVDTRDPAALMEAYMKTAGEWSEQASSQSDIARGAMGDSLGIGSKFMTYFADRWDTDIASQMSSSGRNIGDVQLAGQIKQNNLANDKYTTETAQHTIGAENSMLEVAQFKQKYPDAYEILKSILGTLTGIAGAKLLKSGFDLVSKLFGKGDGGTISKVGSKALNSIKNLSSKALSGIKSAGSKALSGIKSVGGKAISGAAKVGSKALTNLAGASGGSAGLGVAGATAGLAVAAGGTVAAVDGIKNASNKQAGTGSRVASGVQAGAGIAAAGAGVAATGLLLASNPVGWAVLGVGAAALGVAVAAKGISKALDKTSAATKEVTASYDNQLKQMKENQKEEKKNQKEQLKEQKKQLEDLTSLEDKKKYAVENGIISEEDAKSLTEEGFNKIFDEYQKSEKEYLKKKQDAEKKQLEELKSKQEEETQKASEDNEKELLKQISDLESQGDEGKDKVYDILKNAGASDKALKKYKSGEWTAEGILNGKGGGIGFFNTQKDLMKNLDTEDWKAITSSAGLDQDKFKVANMSTDEKAAKDAKYAELKAIVDQGEGDNPTSKERYQSALEQLKKDFSDGKGGYAPPSMYAAGNPFVASDQLAYLHQGEAVLTKTQNKNYRSVASSIPFLSKVFGGGLFGGSLAGDKSEEDSSRTDIITAINENVNKLVEAILSINKSQSQDTVDYNSGMINRNAIANRGYDQNLVSLSPSIATSTK